MIAKKSTQPQSHPSLGSFENLMASKKSALGERKINMNFIIVNTNFKGKKYKINKEIQKYKGEKEINRTSQL